MGGEDGVESVFYYFCDDFINVVTKGDGAKVIERGRIV